MKPEISGVYRAQEVARRLWGGQVLRTPAGMCTVARISGQSMVRAPLHSLADQPQLCERLLGARLFVWSRLGISALLAEADRIAVNEVETTPLYRTDRAVIELVTVDTSGLEIGEFGSVVNPSDPAVGEG